MPKKEKVWTMGNKGPTGPWVWHVWTKGSKKPLRMVAFDQQHIKDQLEGQQMVKAVKQPEEKEEFSNLLPLGPKGYKGSSRTADYDAGFKVLRQWIDENGGPPEEIRQKLRELWIDYDKAKQKTTTYSQKKNGQHKI
jgi:hypothetical protein